MKTYSYDERVHAIEPLSQRVQGAYPIIDRLVYLGIQVFYRSSAEIYHTNRFMLLKSIEQSQKDVVNGIRDSGRPDDQHAQLRSDALMYFLQHDYPRALEYVNVEINGDGLPHGVHKWVKYMGTWARGIPMCSPMKSDEEAIAWAYFNGYLSKAEPWERAEGHYAAVQEQVARARRRSAKREI